MAIDQLTITYVGGPTILLELGGLRLLTDPTFDPAGGEYKTGPVTLRKFHGPAFTAEAIGAFDYVLLSHDHHSDNLDHAGRALLASAKSVFTTTEGAQRLGANSVGLKDWQSTDLLSPDRRILRTVATPARHGPEGRSRGAVNGFALFFADAPERVIYISGDTVWYAGLEDIASRFRIQIAILHLGAARVPEVGSYHLSMTAAEAVEAARSFPHALIVPIHFEDWAHFSEGREAIAHTFASVQLEDRLRWPERGRAKHIF